MNSAALPSADLAWSSPATPRGSSLAGKAYWAMVRRLVLSAGAGFLVPLLGDIIRMPGLPATPQADKIDLVDGEIVGILG